MGISKPQSPFKVVFGGLDNSGKTSILLVLEHKFSLLTNLSPTKGVEFHNHSVLGYPIVEWDLGGQIQFREKYLKDTTLDATDLLFYIIDTQDSTRFEEALKYLSEIITVFREINEESPNLVICLHKIDPDLVSNPQVQTNIEKCENKLQEMLDFDYELFKTSIYNNWTLRKAFSKGILKLSPKSTLLDSMIKEFLELTQSDTLLLLDQEALIFSEYSTDMTSYQLSNIIAPHLATMADKLMKYGKKFELFEGKIRGWIYFKPLNIATKLFYITIFNKNIERVEDMGSALPQLTEKIKNILQAFFI